MASAKPLLSVIIPAYNEEKRLGLHLESVLKFFRSHYPNFELIIVDDGSNDATVRTVSAAISRQPRAHLIAYKPNQGKGYAVRKGVLASRGDTVLFMDADLSTPLSQVPKILKALQDADIVIGSRAQPKSQINKQPPLFRKLASFIFDQIKYSLVGLRRFKDTQCGFKVFRGPVARQLFAKSQIDRFMFDVEILYLAERAGLTIREIPVTWADAPGSTVRFWEGVVNMFRDLWRIRKLHSQKLKNSKNPSAKQTKI